MPREENIEDNNNNKKDDKSGKDAKDIRRSWMREDAHKQLITREAA